ncbi:urea ABC transporter ATP-binding subunit UrtE [Komagataeibacter xylinus]|uniref:Urea ABC transporter ATP-binding subunit UrtE n=1 Tax=Komagataeibacter xylinus TaxID=28448 RepID=A0A318PKX9_KOMXY|nr:urea ABC transporter ATP-binding subunit UrtE [Komagataeibacter xylinus]PYD58286.1 urea ABC transporter ATP-binding subunit UrtE [Komagataeibacter xylinus]GBQ78768.1 urea short-chain amide or branched-chain amino acid transporter ATP-binding protein [Komagataeibacter xylinus NBRC 15237]
MLEINDVHLHYGAAIALRGVSLAARAGAVTCVLGRNGVGKTSLIRAITGMHATSAGTIMWEGEDITRLAAYDRARRGIATVPQGRDIFPLLSVRENLETGFGLLPRGQRRVPDEIFDLFPVLARMRDRRGGDLSGGQQQQLATARALVIRPRLLVLDEPTEGIQPSIIKDIGTIIGMLRDRGDMAIVLVEQYFDFAYELADTIAVLDRGKVVLAGQARDLVAEDVRAYITI